MNTIDRAIFWTGVAIATALWTWNAYVIISAIVK